MMPRLTCIGLAGVLLVAAGCRDYGPFEQLDFSVGGARDLRDADLAGDVLDLAGADLAGGCGDMYSRSEDQLPAADRIAVGHFSGTSTLELMLLSKQTNTFRLAVFDESRGLFVLDGQVTTLSSCASSIATFHRLPPEVDLLGVACDGPEGGVQLYEWTNGGLSARGLVMLKGKRAARFTFAPLAGTTNDQLIVATYDGTSAEVVIKLDDGSANFAGGEVGSGAYPSMRPISLVVAPLQGAMLGPEVAVLHGNGSAAELRGFRFAMMPVPVLGGFKVDVTIPQTATGMAAVQVGSNTSLFLSANDPMASLLENLNVATPIMTMKPTVSPVVGDWNADGVQDLFLWHREAGFSIRPAVQLGQSGGSGPFGAPMHVPTPGQHTLTQAQIDDGSYVPSLALDLGTACRHGVVFAGDGNNGASAFWR